MWLALFWAWLVPAIAQAEPISTVNIAVHAPATVSVGAGTESMTVRARWLGEPRELDLVRDGSGRWTGTLSGPITRAVGLSLWKTEPGMTKPIRVHEGLVLTSIGETQANYAISESHPRMAWRLSDAVSMRDQAASEEQMAMVGVGWTVAVFIAVLAWARRAVPRAPTVSKELHVPMWKEAMGWLVLAVAWTWPALKAGPGGIVGRHFDALGTVWTIDATTRIGLDLHDPLTRWPDGATYSTIDSFTLLPLGGLAAIVGAARLHGLIQILGVAVSGWAAGAFAKALGARTPWHWLAGVFFMGSGLTASALLEGHAYLVMNPWLPLFGLYWWRATQPGGRTRDGTLAAVFFALTLATSGYLGVAGALIALVFAGATVFRGRIPWRPMVVAAGLVLPIGVLYLSAFVGAGEPAADYALDSTLRMSSVSFASLGMPSAELDRAGHSWSLGLSPLMMALCVVGIALRVKGCRTLGVAVGLGLLVAMGPVLALDVGPGSSSVTSPLAWIWDIPGGRYLRFPGRVAWAGVLCGGVLASLGAAALADRLGSRVRWLIALAVVDALVMAGLPFRQTARPAGVPSAYMESSGPIFELLPEGAPRNAEVDSWLSAIVCAHQVGHDRGLAEDCVRVPVADGPRWPLGRAVMQDLFAEDTGAVVQRLSALGFTHLAWHPDWVGSADRVRIETTLLKIDGNPVRSVDGGEAVWVVSLNEGSDSNPVGGLGPALQASEEAPWTARFDLAVPDEWVEGRFFARIEAPAQDPIEIELRDQGQVPADHPNDGVYGGTWSGVVTGRPVISIEMEHGGKRTRSWSGPVTPLGQDEEHLTFKLDTQGQAEPVIRALDTFSSEPRNRGAHITALGWLGVGGLIGLWFWSVRRRPS